MTTRFKITRSSIIAFFIALILAFTFATLTHAEGSDTQVAQKYGITFPVSELGGCNSLTECKNYCEDSTHKDACIAFAKSHGFYKPKPQIEDFMGAAKLELGCDSTNSCKAFCGEQENWIKCGEFAKRHSLRKQTPKASAAYENANENARFCRENPSKCKNASESAILSDNCRNLKEKMGSASAQEIRIYYEKYCLRKPYATNSANFTPKPIYAPKPYPATTSAVRGISTAQGILQNLLHWLGF